MHIKKEEYKKIIKIWNLIIEHNIPLLKEQLNDLEISSLAACIGDCYQSFIEIHVLIDKLSETSQTDYETNHDCIVDLYWELDHIKNHIIDAEKGFVELMRILSEKSETDNKGKDAKDNLI